MTTPTSNRDSNPETPSIADFHVLTPLFYSRVAEHQTFDAALSAEIISAEAQENQTAQITGAASDARALLLRAADESSHGKSNEWNPAESLLDRFLWTLVYMLRQDPEAMNYPSPGFPKTRLMSESYPRPSKGKIRRNDIASVAAPSFLDKFVHTHCGRTEQKEYRKTLLRLFQARRIALGNTTLLVVYRLLLQAMVSMVTAWVLPGSGHWASFGFAFACCFHLWSHLEGIVL